jgi:1-acyl-sn-glycerol-3-phosphate acyltransferase
MGRLGMKSGGNSPIVPGRHARLRVDGDPLSLLLWHVNRIYCRVFHRFAWDGPDPLPEHGGALLVSNHRSSVDPFILSAATRRVISFLIAEEYYRIPLLRLLFEWMGCIPVRRDETDAGALRKTLRALRQGRVVCIFPEGGINKGLDRARPGVGYIALRSGVAVIPAKVEGTPEAESVWRSLLRRSSSRVKFGEWYRAQAPPRGAGARLPGQAKTTTALLMAKLDCL